MRVGLLISFFVHGAAAAGLALLAASRPAPEPVRPLAVAIRAVEIASVERPPTAPVPPQAAMPPPPAVVVEEPCPPSSLHPVQANATLATVYIYKRNARRMLDPFRMLRATERAGSNAARKQPARLMVSMCHIFVHMSTEPDFSLKNRAFLGSRSGEKPSLRDGKSTVSFRAFACYR